MEKVRLTRKEALIHELLFSDSEEFEVVLEHFVSTRSSKDFMEEIREAGRKGGLSFISERSLDANGSRVWKFQVRRKS